MFFACNAVLFLYLLQLSVYFFDLWVFQLFSNLSTWWRRKPETGRAIIWFVFILVLSWKSPIFNLFSFVLCVFLHFWFLVEIHFDVLYWFFCCKGLFLLFIITHISVSFFWSGFQLFTSFPLIEGMDRLETRSFSQSGINLIVLLLVLWYSNFNCQFVTLCGPTFWIFWLKSNGSQLVTVFCCCNGHFYFSIFTHSVMYHFFDLGFPIFSNLSPWWRLGSQKIPVGDNFDFPITCSFVKVFNCSLWLCACFRHLIFGLENPIEVLNLFFCGCTGLFTV